MTNEFEGIDTQSTEHLTLMDSRVGWAAIDAGDYATAFTFFEPWKNDPIGQYFLAEIYLKDPKFQKVRSKGIQLLKHSADANFTWAFLALGNYSATRSRGKKDRQHAIYWFKKSAKKGCPISQYNLGLCYCKIEDFVNGTTWLYLSAATGYNDALKWFVETSKVAPYEQFIEGLEAAYAWLESLRGIDQTQMEPQWSRLLVKYGVDSNLVFSDVLEFWTRSLSLSST